MTTAQSHWFLGSHRLTIKKMYLLGGFMSRKKYL